MSTVMRARFDQFGFWLEETDTYDIRSPDDEIFDFFDNPRRRVVFQAVVAECEEKGIPPPHLPDRTLIAIRSACARVACLSGAAEQMERVQRDMEDTMVLAGDGSTAGLLSSLLLSRCFVDGHG
ncbi:hypothetical protein BJ138DRAFT_1093135 [Hygrophoropsis aurantiaca]|uniref:Uncharacterized protein n=1 Tax=Hygrophoropsis aurantiaca TaxID=72124 RepID=A0ACB8A223_9AGAM|nr:hypothetical protein BJ138DRAFT_1093135 [Hygrophoropsis aurantiaca]